MLNNYNFSDCFRRVPVGLSTRSLYDDDIPVNVAINEAVELAKSYGSDDNAASFVNGVLAKLV